MPHPVSKAQRYAPAAAATASEAAHQVRTSLRGLLLYFLPFPLLIGAIAALVAGNVASTLVLGGSFAAYMLAATIARRGFKLEAEYQRRKIARAPKTPFKTVAALFTAVTTGVLAWLGADYGVLASIMMAAATFLGFALSYGLDPRRDKAGGISLGVTVDEIIEAVDAAEIRIKSIEQARRAIRNPDYSQRLERITSQARQIITTIEEDPTRLSRARKFLKVYLDGTEKVAQGYAKSQNNQQGTTTNLDTDFNRVLDSIEQTFQEQQTKLLENNNFDLDVQIAVLEQQLKREGVF
ncbi:5-bromo-4-chloroindolyl phosphate hydrolysis family protein [Thiothrix eikelboomii]|uniref:5-bromo-4-chloroindolyl phosphate hydrolysis protein n=1 Tax=Thiothrix eikelboomii TaxID=92487 RepID=A0A1T4W5M4_9GAMM|nr:5-bromo-4-chloroindolyl phosphate hydrolysis family protein [Thiothrix eikelboomii]SKA72614.1 5-bromo-4-chloroindolyl phosphate hydrolysis protein [Thiothrix eikelboomii]